MTEVPLLYEVGAEERFDKVVVITAPTALREQRRRVARDDRDSRLLPDREKVRRADYHYVNKGTFEDLFAWVGGVMAELEAEAGPAREAVLARSSCSSSRPPPASPPGRSRAEPEWYQRARYPLRYEAIVRGMRGTTTSPPTLLAAVIYTESKFDADARSGAGAVGLMQLLPETAKGIAVRTGGGRFVVSDLLDPEINVRYGSWYLRNLLNRYDDVSTALAAYHAGQGNVDEWRSKGVGIQFPETRELRRQGRRPARLRRRLRDERATPANSVPGVSTP